MGRQIPGGISRRITMQNNIFDKPSEMLRSILSKDQLSFCEYRFEEDLLISYGNDLKIQKTIPGYLAHIEADSQVHPDDRWKLKEFFQGKTRGEVEVRLQTDDSLKKLLFQVYPLDEIDISRRFMFVIRDITGRQTGKPFWKTVP